MLNTLNVSAQPCFCRWLARRRWRRILGKRPFVSDELRNIDKFKGGFAPTASDAAKAGVCRSSPTGQCARQQYAGEQRSAIGSNRNGPSGRGRCTSAAAQHQLQLSSPPMLSQHHRSTGFRVMSSSKAAGPLPAASLQAEQNLVHLCQWEVHMLFISMPAVLAFRRWYHNMNSLGFCKPRLSTALHYGAC